MCAFVCACMRACVNSISVYLKVKIKRITYEVSLPNVDFRKADDRLR